MRAWSSISGARRSRSPSPPRSRSSPPPWPPAAGGPLPHTITSSCPSWVTADVTYTNQLTGAVDFERSAVILPGTTVGAFADAPAPFSTPYTVTLSVIDFHFNTLTQTSASITTKKPQQVNG